MSNKILDILRKRSLQNLGFTIFWLLILCAYGINAYCRGINMDACFYIAVSGLLNDGLIPFVDFKPGYTPLSFYIMQVPQLITGQNFTILISLLYLIQFFNSYLLYRIVLKETGSVNLSQFSAIFFMIINLLWAAEYILEPFILLFGFLSMICWYKPGTKYLLLTGFLCFCSFWCKQYGVGFLLLAFIYQAWKGSFSVRSICRSSIILAGFLIGAAFFISILLLQGVSISDLSGFSGGSYEKDGINGLIEGYILLFKMVPMLILTIILSLIKLRQSIRKAIIVVSYCGIFGFMLQCYVRLYGHYLILAIPFCALLLSTGTKLITSRDKRGWYKVLLVLTLILPLRYLIPSTVSMMQSTEKQEQVDIAMRIEKMIPYGTNNVFASQDLLYVTLLNSYRPPLLDKYGLSNGFVRKSQEIMDLCEQADYCLIGTEEATNTKRFSGEVRAYLSTRFNTYTILGSDNTHIGNLYVRK